jgi:RNA polymerase sigma-70 factor (ECF subfamily)
MGSWFIISTPPMNRSSPSDCPPDETTRLLAQARAGDRDALEQLFAKHIPLLRRWAAGRLPGWARRGVDTSDVVQDTVIATLSRLDAFEPRGEGTLQAYLRRAVMNAIRSLLRRANSAPQMLALDERAGGVGPSPLDLAVGNEMIARYQVALTRLTDIERDAVVGRVEFGLSYPALAELLDRPSPDAARMIVTRALMKVIRDMERGGQRRSRQSGAGHA